MDIQFFHDLPLSGSIFDLKGHTVAVKLPSKEEFAKLISNPFKTITLEVGLAVCSRKDNFEYKKGREISTSKLSPVTFELKRISFNEDKSLFSFNNKDEDGSVLVLDIRMNEKSERLHLISVGVDDILLSK